MPSKQTKTGWKQTKTESKQTSKVHSPKTQWLISRLQYLNTVRLLFGSSLKIHHLFQENKPKSPASICNSKDEVRQRLMVWFLIDCSSFCSWFGPSEQTGSFLLWEQNQDHSAVTTGSRIICGRTITENRNRSFVPVYKPSETSELWRLSKITLSSNYLLAKVL